MKNCLGQEEIYQLLPGPRTGCSLLPTLRTWSCCGVGVYLGSTGCSGCLLPGLCQGRRCCCEPGSCCPAGAFPWGWAQLPHCCSVICFFRYPFSKSTWWGHRGQDSHNLSLWFHPLHSQERFRNQSRHGTVSFCVGVSFQEVSFLPAPSGVLLQVKGEQVWRGKEAKQVL